MGLHFSKEEFSQRKTKVLKSMKEQNLDALLMFRQESMYWLTGYDTFGYVFFQTLILEEGKLLMFFTELCFHFSVRVNGVETLPIIIMFGSAR